MRRGRSVNLLSAVLIALTLTLALYPVALLAFQEDGGDRRGRLAERMLEIAEKLRVRAEVAFRIAERRGWNGNITGFYENGVALYENATEEYEAGNYTGALRLAVQAMRSFKHCISLTLRSWVENASVGWMGLTVAADRLEKFIGRIYDAEGRLVEFYGNWVNVTSVEKLLEEAGSLLEEARTLLEEGNVTGAARLLGEARVRAAEALAELRRMVNQGFIKSLKMKLYIDRFFAEFKNKVRKELKWRGLFNPRSRFGRMFGEAQSLEEEARTLIAQGRLREARVKIIDAHRILMKVIWEARHGRR